MELARLADAGLLHESRLMTLSASVGSMRAQVRHRHVTAHPSGSSAQEHPRWFPFRRGLTAPLRLNTFKFALFIAKLFEGDPVCGRTAADRWQLYCTAGAMSSSSSFLII